MVITVRENYQSFGVQVLKKIGGGVIFVGINIANNFTWLKWVAICLFLSPCGVVKLWRGRGEKARGKNSGELSALFSFSFSTRLVQNVKISHYIV